MPTPRPGAPRQSHIDLRLVPVASKVRQALLNNEKWAISLFNYVDDSTKVTIDQCLAYLVTLGDLEVVPNHVQKIVFKSVVESLWCVLESELIGVNGLAHALNKFTRQNNDRQNENA